MYDTCPKCQHQRAADDQTEANTCPACGLIFDKWLKSQLAASKVENTVSYSGTISSSISANVTTWLFQVEDKTNPLVFWGRALVFTGLCIWGWKFIQMDFVINPFQINRSFMHKVDLVFHEAGHVIFMPFGRFMSILGGSLLQLLMPLIVLFTFLIKNHNPFAASVGLWWTGQNLIDLAPYIDDAIDQKLILLGGRTGADAPGNHDWGNIFIELDMLEKHRQIASFADNSGTIIILLAIIWGAYILYKQYPHRS